MALEAVEAGADIVMLDNMSHDAMKEAVRAIGGRALVEISGNVTAENAAQIIRSYIRGGGRNHWPGRRIKTQKCRKNKTKRSNLPLVPAHLRNIASARNMRAVLNITYNRITLSIYLGYVYAV